MPKRLHILYLVHDLYDPAVKRRVTILADGEASVTIAGFRREPKQLKEINGYPVVNFARTYNGRFIHRVDAVINEIIGINFRKDLFVSADLVIARNLEMLAIAVAGKKICKPAPPIVYESLDIHRLLLGKGIVGKIMRKFEGWLAKKASALITSSPAFVDSYFTPLSSVKLPIRMVENKVYVPGNQAVTINQSPRHPGPPWRIGWFGALRCKKSLQLLADLAARMDGKVEVILRGRPALDQFDDFHKTVSETPHLQFLGPYKNPDDLEAIYHDVHFTWAIDMFEEGLNSSWLLPNRLYEGGLYHAVPIAASGVETSRFLQTLGIGVTLSEPKAITLHDFFLTLTPQNYVQLEQDVMRVPKTTWSYNPDDCRELVAYLSSLN